MKLPLGIQHFDRLREEGYVYIDKTREIHDIVTSGKFYFLSRPRRFGKSLVVSTLNELYSGTRHLFEGLWIEDNWDWGKHHPIIWLRFASSGFQDIGLRAAIFRLLDKTAAQYGLAGLEEQGLSLRLEELIQKLHHQYGKVVLLIDEYDKPIIDYVDDRDKMEEHRDLLKTFYSALKDNSQYLELVFITGVTAFSQVSIFSDLNSLTNLTLNGKAATLTGITATELENTFGKELADVDREFLRQWLNGYSWDGQHFVYNPWGLFNFLDTKEFSGHWFQTGTPTFLVKLMKRVQLFRPSGQGFSAAQLLTFDIDLSDPVPILFQTGYLTVKRKGDAPTRYYLDYPNLEVRNSIELLLLDVYLETEVGTGATRVETIRRALHNNDLDALIATLNANFAAIPYDHWTGQNEHFFHALIFLTFRLIGLKVTSEVHTANGRCDVLVETDAYVYVFEFKMDGSVEEALTQITDRGYLAAYAEDERHRIAVGATFSSATKNISDWKAVALE